MINFPFIIQPLYNHNRKNIVVRHYADTEKMETVFKQRAGEQITKKIKEMTQNNAKLHLAVLWKI